MLQISAAYFQLPIFSSVTLVVRMEDRGKKARATVYSSIYYLAELVAQKTCQQNVKYVIIWTGKNNTD